MGEVQRNSPVEDAPECRDCPNPCCEAPLLYFAWPDRKPWTRKRAFDQAPLWIEGQPWTLPPSYHELVLCTSSGDIPAIAIPVTCQLWDAERRRCRDYANRPDMCRWFPLDCYGGVCEDVLPHCALARRLKREESEAYVNRQESERRQKAERWP